MRKLFQIQVITIVLLAVAIIILALAPRAKATDEEDMIRSVITEDEETRIAQMLYGEDRSCGDADDTMKQAAVVWCVFNRVDAWDKTVTEVITPSQFHGWKKGQQHPEWSHEIVRDVALRWAREKQGETDVGRVLPKEYLFFSAGGRHEKFRTGYRTSDYWDWGWENPYAEESS